MKIKYTGPCKEVTVQGYGTFVRGKVVDIVNGEALVRTNAGFVTVQKEKKETKTTKEVKKNV